MAAARSELLRALGEALKRSRHQRGWSQEEAAWHCGVYRTYFSMVERGERNPTYASLIKLSNGLGLSPAELVALAESLERPQKAAVSQRPSLRNSPAAPTS
jgi:transcriptional regulator with XRE-family HTH domain